VLNSNVLLAQRLLKEPKIDNVDAIYSSLHTTEAKIFKEKLGTAASAARTVMDNMILLKRHGYRVQINYSLGDYNKYEFAKVLDFAIENGIDLKGIALIRPHDDPSFYGGEWINPNWVEQIVERTHLKRVASKEGFGGRTITWQSEKEDSEGKVMTVEVKNIATGRLITDYCRGCRFMNQCGCVSPDGHSSRLTKMRFSLSMLGASPQQGGDLRLAQRCRRPVEALPTEPRKILQD
jgi:MoaA/NifB/PqqE/SkfB family radical SAM enzyme